MPEAAIQNDDPSTLAANLYKQNVEILGKNKTLSLLSKLYGISILTLEPPALAQQISTVIQTDLSLEFAAVLLTDKEKKVLTPLGYSASERIKKIVETEKDFIAELETPLQSNEFLSSVIEKNSYDITEKVKDIFGPNVKKKLVEAIQGDGHIKSSAVYPLVIQNAVIGVLMLSMNRPYDDLIDYEKETIDNAINVVAVALDKALLYGQLKEANAQLTALDKARAEFISIASHQLRTPPATIKWYVAAILGGDFGPLSDDLKAALQRTMTTNDAQIATIDDLLNASRIERGKLEFFFEENPLEPIVSALVEQMQPLAGMKKMSIEYKKPTEVLPNILMDKEKIRQVLNNMIDNAIKYSPSGVITVGLKKVKEDLVISVKDTGKGIAPVDVGKVFEKYQRGHDSMTHATGLGLGMYVAKVIIDQHNGKIWAESEGVGKGATFCFSLPIHNTLKPTSVDLAGDLSK